MIDNTDLFREQIGPDGCSVRQGDRFVPCEVREEVIAVKGEASVTEHSADHAARPDHQPGPARCHRGVVAASRLARPSTVGRPAAPASRAQLRGVPQGRRTLAGRVVEHGLCRSNRRHRLADVRPGAAAAQRMGTDPGARLGSGVRLGAGSGAGRGIAARPGPGRGLCRHGQQSAAARRRRPLPRRGLAGRLSRRLHRPRA